MLLKKKKTMLACVVSDVTVVSDVHHMPVIVT
jgi:hypothetical protein